MPLLAQCGALAGRAAILPDDGRRDRRAGRPVPQHRGFALVRDADSCDPGRADRCVAQRRLRTVELRRPDLRGVVFHPAGLRIVLAEFLLRQGDDATGPIEENCP